ncbi:MAG: pseudaminic acid synthase [Lachnospiraceae bacterium]
MFKKICESGVYIIAEISANHAGKLDNALEIVRQAAKAGADCVKIQTYTADTLTIDCDNEYFKIENGLWDGYKLYDLYKEAFTPWEWHDAIKKECEACDVDFLSTPFDKTAVDFLEELNVSFYKIASFELVDIPLIEYTASKGKPMIISTGMGSVEEIEEAIDACKRMGNDQIILLKCCSDYPANFEDMKLSNITDMKERFKDCIIGFSDHSMGSLAPVVATSLGAKVLEKHICISREIKSPDSDFAMELSEFKEMVEQVRNTQILLGTVDYSLTQKEKNSSKFRRSLFVVEDVAAGEVLTEKKVRSIRPSHGMKPKFFKQCIGKVATRDLQKGTPLKENDFE